MASADYYQNNNGNYNEMNDAQKGYGQQPPQYAQQPQYAPNPAAAETGYGEKPTFDQAFKIDKPKWNDLWAGILVSAAHAYMRKTHH